MNRDWFARTQPETDAKLEMLRRYPGPLFVDDHEMGSDDFFFPAQRRPDLPRDPRRGGGLDQQRLRRRRWRLSSRQGIPFFNRDFYDLFYMGYGGHRARHRLPLSAAMTYEKNNATRSARAYEQYVAQWVSLSRARSVSASC